MVLRFQDGDERAFEELMSRHSQRVYDMVWRLLRDPEDAKEITQDAFVRAHRGLGKFRNDSAFATWLYQIATNLARNRFWYWWRRKRDHHLSLDAPTSVQNGEAGPDLADVIPTEQLDAAEIAEIDELTGSIGYGMGYLDARHREVLILRCVKELSYEEIATTLCINVGTVKSRIARARESLRGKIAHVLEGK